MRNTNVSVLSTKSINIDALVSCLLSKLIRYFQKSVSIRTCFFISLHIPLNSNHEIREHLLRDAKTLLTHFRVFTYCKHVKDAVMNILFTIPSQTNIISEIQAIGSTLLMTIPRPRMNPVSTYIGCD